MGTTCTSHKEQKEYQNSNNEIIKKEKNNNKHSKTYSNEINIKNYKNYPNCFISQQTDLNNSQIEDNKNLMKTISAPVNKLLTFPNFRFIGGSFNFDIRKIYKFKEVLGGGHFGCIRLGYKRGENPKRYYAIKSIRKKNLTNTDLNDMLNEVEIISKLRHPNIIKFYETYHDEKYFHIVMEYCKGKDLFEKINQYGFISENIVKKIISKLVHAISYCHSKNLTHRDLKLENILFINNDMESEIKLIDFGLACKYEPNKKMTTFAGSPYYIAPEVLKGNYDNKCDIWSIGIITYVMLTGILPFEGETNDEIFNKILTKEVNFEHPNFNIISNEAKMFIKLCLEKDPNKRISAQRLIENNWIKNSLLKNNSLKSDILYNLKNLNAINKMKVLIISYIVNNLSQTEQQKLQDAFYAIDLDHTGQICSEELYKACEENNIPISKSEINNIIQNLNICYNRASNKNVLDYQQFLMAVYDIEKNIDRNKIEKAFEFFDINQDGFIDVDDLKNFYLRSGLKLLNEDEDIKEIIKEISKNDKKINLNHFLQLFNFL